jgi:isopenicillin N synthase-like dioxygenase
VNKGSFYANPQFDEPTSDQALIKKYYQDYHPNVWPKEDVPELESAFKNMGSLMVSVGELVAKHCDLYVSSKLGDKYKSGTLESVVKSSRTAKGRLLHYFPVLTNEERTHDSWCTWHNDHSALTALSSAYFTTLTEPNKEVPSPDPASGLYAKTRTGQIVKIAIPKDHLAFQIGETSQILTGAILRATPHAVQAPKYPESTLVQRDTFAVFMQPNHDLLLDPPTGVAAEAVAVGAWRPGLTYSEFSKGTIEGYYDTQ